MRREHQGFAFLLFLTAFETLNSIDYESAGLQCRRYFNLEESFEYHGTMSKNFTFKNNGKVWQGNNKVFFGVYKEKYLVVRRPDAKNIQFSKKVVKNIVANRFNCYRIFGQASLVYSYKGQKNLIPLCNQSNHRKLKVSPSIVSIICGDDFKVFSSFLASIFFHLLNNLIKT